jgi:putative FmdB family regulatory protein
MPIYVFRCQACDRAQEHLLGLHEPTPPCEKCGEHALEKQVTAATFRFERSTGWDGWDKIGPNTIGRVVDRDKHITDPAESKNPGSRKST